MPLHGPSFLLRPGFADPSRDYRTHVSPTGILAMGDGKGAAHAIDACLKKWRARLRRTG